MSSLRYLRCCPQTCSPHPSYLLHITLINDGAVPWSFPCPLSYFKLAPRKYCFCLTEDMEGFQSIMAVLRCLVFSTKFVLWVPSNLPQLFPPKRHLCPLYITSDFPTKMLGLSPLNYTRFSAKKCHLCPLHDIPDFLSKMLPLSTDLHQTFPQKCSFSPSDLPQIPPSKERSFCFI